MPKNVVIFSDGTGQRGGLLFDERRSNIYKLYRATRCGPDSDVDPLAQYAFYDPGIGTLPQGVGFFGAAYQWVYNLVSQATGLGLTENIIDCYAEIVRNWRPGDRIYLFGFSRGAYTARCVAAVVALCGVPTRMRDGTPLKRDEGDVPEDRRACGQGHLPARQFAEDKEYAPQRLALAVRFREQFASGTPERPNVFLLHRGVRHRGRRRQLGLAVLATGLWAIVASALSIALYALTGAFWPWFWTVLSISVTVAAIAYLKINLKWATGCLVTVSGRRSPDRTAHAVPRPEPQLQRRWRAHAIAIDEYRKDFDRVPWGTRRSGAGSAGRAGVVQAALVRGLPFDIGGSYPEPESRLSTSRSIGWRRKRRPSRRADRRPLRAPALSLGRRHAA